MGAMASVGQSECSNFKHIIFNNGVHDSVGAQPTDAANPSFSFPNIALACGYKKTFLATNEQEIKDSLEKLKRIDGPALVEIKCDPGNYNYPS